MDTYCIHGNERELNRLGIANIDHFLDMDCAEYVLQRDYGDHSEGQFFIVPDRLAMSGERTYLVTVNGSFGNYNSPGASSYTYVNLFDLSDPSEVSEYLAWVKRWESLDEWSETDDDTEDESDSELDESDPTEPTDGDYVTNNYHIFYEYGGINKRLPLTFDPDSWNTQLSEYMEKTVFWPNCWYLGERGDWNLLSLETGTYV